MSKAIATAPRGLVLSPEAGLSAYLASIRRIPILTAVEEQTLARRYRDAQDVDAARELVISHLRFVAHIARGYRGYGLGMGDLIQEGNVGLMKAVKRFDPDAGVRLISYAVHWIRAEIHEYILKNWRIVKVATTKAQRKLFFNLRSSKQRLGWFSQDEVRAVAKDLGVPERDVVEMESRLAGQDVGFDPQPETTSEDEPHFSPAGYLAAPEESDPATLIESADWAATGKRKLKQSLTKLDKRSRDILQRRRLNEPKATLQELADEYGVSAERVRQIESGAIKKLRAAMA